MSQSPGFGRTSGSDGMGLPMGTSSSFDGEGGDAVGASFASAFRNRGTAMTTEELRKARESRAAEALRMKDQQLQILTEQNGNLLKTLDKLEEEANTIQLEKLAIEQENRGIRDTNFELQSKARAAETTAKRVQMEVADKEKQLRIMTDQNSELLRLLESEEAAAASLQAEVHELRSELDEIRQKYTALLVTAKSHEELAAKAAREGQLRAEEIRLLRVEVEQLKAMNTELKMKTQIEVEALQEQLRVRKEKQYQILEKLQVQEEAQRQAGEQVAGLEEQVRSLHARNLDLETASKVEARGKNTAEEANKELQVENSTLFSQNRDLTARLERADKERLRMEAEARDTGNNLREVSAKIFQIMERLKLAELGKAKAFEALKKKEQEILGLQKKNSKYVSDLSELGKEKVQVDADLKIAKETEKALKKSNFQLARSAKEEAGNRLKIQEEKEGLQERLSTMESRLSFLLNKATSDEESRLLQGEDRKRLESQLLSYSEKTEELTKKLSELGESNRIVAQALRLKQEEVNDCKTQLDLLQRELVAKEADLQLLTNSNNTTAVVQPGGGDSSGNAPDDIDAVRLNAGRGRFYVEAKATSNSSNNSGALLLLKARKPIYKEWLESKHNANDFLRRAQKTTRFRDLMVERLGMAYGLLMVEEEDRLQILDQLKQRDEHAERQQRRMQALQDALGAEEDAKRCMLLRYIHAVKEHAMSSNNGGSLQLPEANLGDEEVHALAALLRSNTTIEELNLRGNLITDDGARALAAVLAGRSALRLVDLRGNRLSRVGIKLLAEALERAERVKHVYVHAGGKIEALGTSSSSSSSSSSNTGGQRWAGPRPDGMSSGAVETVCVVDVRETAAAAVYALPELSSGGNHVASSSSFQPSQLLDRSAAPPAANALRQGNSPPRRSKDAGNNNKKDKQQQQQQQLAPSMTSLDPATEAKEREKERIRQHEEQLRALKEGGWQGRAGGLDILPAPLALTLGNDVMHGMSSNVFRRHHKGGGMQPKSLPPLDPRPLSRGLSAGADRGGGSFKLAESFGLDADSPEALLMQQQLESAMQQAAEDTEGGGGLESPENNNASEKKKGKKKKKKRISETEKRLQDSPFLQPVVPLPNKGS